MRYPTKEQRDGARAQKAGNFGLTKRAALVKARADAIGTLRELGEVVLGFNPSFLAKARLTGAKQFSPTQ